jgi:sugar phosphate isomerase/epimerase
MRLRHPDGSIVHLAYCTNVHPAESVAGIHEQLEVYAARVRERLDAGVIGLGLWLPAPTAARLAADPAETARLRGRLAELGLETVTLNGFPYRGFHDPVVKHAVYRPDWTSPDRLAYTLDLARVLTGLLPEDAARGSVSTVPFGWREPWPAASRDAAGRQLDALGRGLAELEAETGRTVRVGLEPEPGCVAETVPQVLAGLAGTDPARLGLCLDACHLAVAHEDPASSVTAAERAGVPIVKTQASAALLAERPQDPATRAALRAFDEPRFLHQVREFAAGGGLHDRDDLGDALAADGGLPANAPWRIHYHIPLHRDPAPPLAGTRPVLSETLRALFGGPTPATDHVEVETYTWTVLPERHRPAGPEQLAAGIAAELHWCHEELRRCGLTPC